ncbi:two-component system regulatory protein YycI [Pediococcus argentinicus]|uniref:two-component system regulatory protein YycI n=1 Tax=Pediococcus argentinicus TaxID=480391 RepID=UPI00338D7807
MNFKRIELMFIVVFAVLDAFLFASFWQNQAGIHTTTNSNRNATILKEMRNDQITFEPLSNSKSKGYYASANNNSNDLRNMKQLVGQSSHLVDGKLVSTLDTPLQVDRIHPSKVLNNFVKISSHIIHGTEYEYNSSLSTDDQVVYTQMIDDRPVYSHQGQLIFDVNGQGVVNGYTQGYLANIEPLRESDELISQTRAVTWLYQYNEIPNDSRIEWANLGYTRLLSSDNGLVYVPTWVVAIKSKSSQNIQLKRINAFTGVMLKRVTQQSGETTTSDTLGNEDTSSSTANKSESTSQSNKTASGQDSASSASSSSNTAEE